MSFCQERNIKIWKCNNKERKAYIVHEYKIGKIVNKIVVLTKLEPSNIERFLIVFSSGESELFEFDNSDESFWWIESEKAREHDCELTGCDYNPRLGLIVTSDKNGVIRIWNKDKKFLREIHFPNPVDSVCFLNIEGDILVSHSKRISHIKFTSYWTKIFDYYGISNKIDDPVLNEIRKENESILHDSNFVVEED